MKTEVRTITPEDAAKMLENNPHNRGFRKSNLNRLVAAMINGTWKLNGETIKIAKDGRVVDGQHRLMASVISGCYFQSFVIYDVPLDVFQTIDIGQSRTVSDFHSFHGEPNAKRIASTINGICAFENKTRVWLSFEEQVLFLEKNPLIRDVVETRLLTASKGVAPSMEHSCRYVIGFHFGMEVAADWFSNFANANYDEPQRKLALYLAKRRPKNHHTDTAVVCAHICQAAKMSITGKPKTLAWSQDDAFPLELEEIYL